MLRGLQSPALVDYDSHPELERTEAQQDRALLAHITSLLERMSDAFLAVDRDWRIVFLNGAGERIAREVFGISGPILGRVFWEAVPQAVGSPFEQIYRTAMADQTPVRLEEFLAPVNAWFEVRIFPSADGLAFFFQDVTDRRRTEEGLRFLAAASASLAESLDYEVTLKRVAQLAVPDISDFCLIDLAIGGKALTRVATHASREVPVPIDGARNFAPPLTDARLFLSEAFRTGQPQLKNDVTEDWLREHVAINDEHYGYLQQLGIRSLMALPLTARGHTLGVITFGAVKSRRYDARDAALASEVAARAALAIDNARLYAGNARLYEESQRAARIREEILAIVSHDLRNPLGAIVTGAASQMRLAGADEQGRAVRKYAEVIQRSAQRMSRLIDDLTDIGNIEAGRLTVRRAEEDPRAIVRDVVDAVQAAAAERGTIVQEGTDGDLGTVECDRERIVQALSNIAANAVNVTVGGTIVVAAQAANERREVQFSVSDTGPGIAPEDLPRIFQRHWRSRDAAYKGTGLGLAIAQGIVEAHGGRIWAESTPGVGTRFFIALPR